MQPNSMAQIVLPEWVQYANALGPALAAFVFGAIAAYIAYRQWQTAQAKLKLDLFKERLAVVTELQAQVLRYSNDQILGPKDWMRDMRLRFEFLFGRAGTRFFDQIISEIEENETVNQGRNPTRNLEIDQGLRRFAERASKAFSAYLDLSTIR